ncbi:MAG: DUF3240 family protein [Gammaproteobacteria bacterium]|nr:DUF3240 family protein [Gammaproteobacteria bacterium]MCB1924786.1 DUF3240 family protein [Gammaproteobacteria bacterium]
MTETCLLNLVVSPEVEDAVTDWLLDQPSIRGFTSHPIAGHGSSEHSMSLAEKVAGRRRQVLFKLHLECAAAERLLEAVKRDFSGSGMHYWMIPVLASGHLA